MKSPKPTSATMKSPTTEFTTETEEHIRERAYELYEQRGREDGHDLEDWLQAESELNLRHRKAIAA